jgi:ABC-type nitrate/sulfonate/bicarbonate transport system substrate-binding protein
MVNRGAAPLCQLDRDERRLIAMKQGLADAVALSPPFNYLAKKDGFVVLARAYELFSYPPSGLTTSVKKIKDRREEIKRVIRALLEIENTVSPPLGDTS